MLNNPLISIVVTTKNEEKNIENCLKSIKNQSYKNFEIIVVDNFSTDKTVALAKMYTNKIYQIGPERSSQRNFGLKEIATGDYGIYLDADMIMAPNLLEQFIENLNDEVVGYYIEEIILGKTFFNRIRRFERFFYNETCIDAVRIISLSTFKKVGGFDEKLFYRGSGEDWDLDLKLSKVGKFKLVPKIKKNQVNIAYFKQNFPTIFEKAPTKYWQNDAVLFHNESELRFFEYLKKKKYYTKGFDGYINKWGSNNPSIQKQFGFCYRYFTVFVENGKWKLSLARPHLILAILIYKLIVGLIYLESRVKRK